MTTLVTTIENTLCVTTTLENLESALDVHQAKVDATIIEKYGEAYEHLPFGEVLEVSFVTYYNGKYSYEGYYITEDRYQWACGDHDYYWSIRIKGIDYDVEDDLEDEEEGWE